MKFTVESPHVSIIVVNHNHREHLATCLNSLAAERARTSYSVEVILIDNFSQGSWLERSIEKHPFIRLTRNAQPQGFAANNNAGIRMSRGNLVLLLNPDTEVLPGTIDVLATFLEEHPGVGACGPQLLFPDGNLQLSCRRFPSFGSFLARRTPMRSLMRSSSAQQRHLMSCVDHSVTMDVDWLLGACIMFRRQALDEIGWLDEGFYLYVEDIDVCFRLHQKGWRVCYVPAARVVHHHLAVTDEKWISKRVLYHYKGMFRFVWKHYFPRFSGRNE